MVQMHCIYKGRVQGVGFRYTVCRLANQHGILGWVKNLPDGSVEMMAQGGQQDVEACCQSIENYFCENITDLKKGFVDVASPYSNFTIKY